MKMLINKGIILTLGVFIAFSAAKAQTELLSETVPVRSGQESFGPNQLNHFMGSITISQFLPIGEFRDEIKLSQSQNWNMEAIYKRKISQTTSLILGLGADFQRFGFKTDQNSILFAMGDYEKEILKTQLAFGDFGLRINLDKRRGNHLGHYLDIGLTTKLLITGRHILFAAGNEETDFFRKSKTIESGMSYLNPFHYGFLIRFGINRICLEYRYQATSIFDKELISGNPPGHQLGISTLIMN